MQQRRYLYGGRSWFSQLKLSGVSAATFAVLYNYMTTGKLDMSPEIVADVFNAAFRLHMSDVVKKCIQVGVLRHLH